MNILEFSDELLLTISAFLDGKDRLCLSKTCCRFENLMKDRTCLRILNFSKSYVPFIDLKKFLRPGRNYVLELNLTSCQHLKSADILNLAQSLPNLEIFYVADTKFTIQHMFLLLSENKQVSKLSFTWNQKQYLDDLVDFSFCVGLASVQSLYVYVTPSNTHANLHKLVDACVSLRELRIVSLTCIHARDFFTHLPKQLRSMSLSCRSCCGYTESMTSSDVAYLTTCGIEWDYFIFDYRGKDVYTTKPFFDRQDECLMPQAIVHYMQHSRGVSFPDDIMTTQHDLVSRNLRLASANAFCASGDNFHDNYTSLQQLKIFRASQLKVCERLSFPNLKEVRIPEENQISGCLDLSVLKHWTKLTKLSLPTCVLKPQKKSVTPLHCQEFLPLQSKRRRVARDTPADNKSLLQDLVKSSPDLEELDIRGCHTCTGDAEISTDTPPLTAVQAEDSLQHVALWSNLERLVLSNMPIRTGAFLLKVAQSCPKLWSLHLSNLGLKGLCTYTGNLIKALPDFKNLKDFRLYQKHVGDIAAILAAVKKCSKLERLAIICAANVMNKLRKDTVVDFVKEAEHLVFFFLCLDRASFGVKEADTLQKL